jgi:beta-N-acetylhexosaminidase
LTQFDTRELVPFKAAIQSGVKMIMVGHLLVPQVDPKNPASLSAIWITKVLREQLGFEGIVLSDDLRMKAITDRNHGMGLSVQEATIRSIEAGTDMVLGPVKEVYQGLQEGLNSGRISQARINESVRRILEINLTLAQNKSLDSIRPREIYQYPEIQEVNRESSQRAVTILRSNPTLIKIKPSDRVLIVSPREVDDVGKHKIGLFDYAKRIHPNIKFEPMNLEPTEIQEKQILVKINQYDHVIFCIYDHPYKADNTTTRKQISILRKVLAKNPHVQVILLKDPSLVQRLPAEATTVIATFGIKIEQLESAIDIIFGRLIPK